MIAGGLRCREVWSLAAFAGRISFPLYALQPPIGAVGAYMDRQEQELRRQTAGSGVEIERRGDELVLTMPSGITFAFDRYDVQPQFRPTLDRVAEVLGDYPQTMIDIYGHTDSVGADAYNQTLSENRARAVADYLSMQGVNKVRMATLGYGETQPIADNETESGRAANRRLCYRPQYG